MRMININAFFLEPQLFNKGLIKMNNKVLREKLIEDPTASRRERF